MVLALLVAAALPVLPVLNAGPFLSLAVRLEALALWVVCLAPGWVYAATAPGRRAPIPFLPVFGVVYGAYFALPPALGLTNLGGFGSYVRPEDYAAAVDAAVLGWAGVLVGLRLSRAVLPDGLPVVPALRLDVALAWARRLAVVGSLVDLLLVTTVVPVVLGSLAVFVLTVGRFGLALGVLLVARGHGRRSDVLVLAVCMAVTAVALLSSGILSGLLFLGVTVGFGLWAGRGVLRRREVVAALALVLTVVTLRGVIPEFRDIAWYSGDRYSLPDRIALMASLVEERIDSEGEEADLLGTGAEQVGKRSAAADLLADVIQRTPADVPYWRGETYVSLVGALVPRLLWPDKPEKNLGQRFGHRYSYLDVHDTGTSINLPWLVEAYANFGMPFVPVLGAVVGLILGLLGWALNRPGQGVLTTALGIALLVPLYGMENDFSLIFGGLILSGAALAVVARVLRHAARPEGGRWQPPVRYGVPSGRPGLV
jgi:hypothetical protein